MDRFVKRRERVKKKIKELNLDAYLVLHPANRFYLSGFELQDPQCNESAGCILILPDKEDYLLTDPRYFETAQKLWDKNYLFIYTSNKEEEIKKFLIKNKLKDIGFEPNIMTYEFYKSLSESVNLHPYKGLIESLREIKDEDEINFIKESVKINHKVFDRLNSMELIGVTEEELAWEIEKLFRDFGATEMAFNPIVAYGKNAAEPHYTPGKIKVQKNGCLLIDIGGRYKDYCSDQTRTFWIGDRVPDYFSRVLDLVISAQRLAIENLKVGMRIKDLFFLVKDFFNENGVGDNFTHALGHGIGLETHEAPALGSRNNKTFKPGMVVTIEPGLYFPEWGGVRWEHMVVVTEEGAKVL